MEDGSFEERGKQTPSTEEKEAAKEEQEFFESSSKEERESFWDRRIGKRLEGILPDVVKRTMVGTLGSVVLSEDGLRQTLSDLRLPKEIANFILQQADNTRKEFMKIVAREVRGFLESTNFYDELRRILTSLSFEIRTEVRLIPNEQAFVKPKIKNSVKVKRDGGKNNKSQRGEKAEDTEDSSDTRQASDDEDGMKSS